MNRKVGSALVLYALLMVVNVPKPAPKATKHTPANQPQMEVLCMPIQPTTCRPNVLPIGS